MSARPTLHRALRSAPPVDELLEPTYVRAPLRNAVSGETPLVQAVADVIEECIANGPVHVSTAHIIQRCTERGIVSPSYGSGGRISYGTVTRTLELLRKAGVVTWMLAYVFRWHFDRLPIPGQPVTIRHPDGSYSLPARKLSRVETVPEALVAPEIEHVRGGGPMQEALPRLNDSVTIGSAPSADGRPELAADWRERLKLRWG